MRKLLTALLATFITTVSTNHTWKVIDNKHYQIDNGVPDSPQKDLSNGVCKPGMIRVSGQMKQDPSPNPYSGQTIEALQKTTCIKWLNKEFPERCIEFDRSKWLSISANLTTKPMNFCIDQYEYPNQKGQYPMIFVNWYEAKHLCEVQGKRLCTETEWTFSCEGEEALPYPYGYVRDKNICVIDRPWKLYHASGMHPRDKAANELDRLWQGEPSGSQPNCKSPFGVYDLTGNVDEWTQKDLPYGRYQSVLKGGYWGPVRTRCRPATRGHNENHTFYQQGLRCCSDPNNQ
ncbi:MAG TPA: SUMF1/EgtB/PvdO family nonheme iron enzyme [Anaerovoracaceae bacterium]|nr:SUMF1/EgtB/PvdO family nonheme iron enzyme [Anaerovoracaceae bacterium]